MKFFKFSKKKLEKVSFYEYTVRNGDEMKLIGEKWIEYPSAIDRTSRRTFYEKIIKSTSSASSSWNTAPKQDVIYSMSIKSSTIKSARSVKEFLVLEQFGFERNQSDTAEILTKISESTAKTCYKHIPIAGIALNKEYFTTKVGFSSF